MTPAPLDAYREATLWPRGSDAVISHASALDLYGLGDANPAKIHLTLPRAHRPRREVPRQYVLHHEDLAPADLRLYEGIPVVMPEKAIRQSRRIGPELLRGAVEDGLRSGLLRTSEAEDLRRELGLGGVGRGASRYSPREGRTAGPTRRRRRKPTSNGSSNTTPS